MKHRTRGWLWLALVAMVVHSGCGDSSDPGDNNANGNVNHHDAGTNNDNTNDNGNTDPCDGHCTNDTQDCGETGTDCGGDCDPCLPIYENLFGVSLACAEFGDHTLPGTYGIEYTYPTQAEVDYFTGKGMSVIRVPFLWERLQRTLGGPFDTDEQARMDAIVSTILDAGAWVVLDPHNYARYDGTLIGDGVAFADFADFWTRLATRYTHERVIYALMNEPHSMTTELWLQGANAAIAAIRQTGATNLLLVPGNAYTGAHSWTQDWYGTPNGDVMLGVVDPLDNYAFEVHQYLDSDSSGTSPDCVSTTIGSERLADFTAWLRTNGHRGFLGEFAGGPNQQCYDAMDDMLTYMDNNPDVWIGWTYWAAGPWWGDYFFSLEPDGAQDAPQMATIESHL